MCEELNGKSFMNRKQKLSYQSFRNFHREIYDSFDIREAPSVEGGKVAGLWEKPFISFACIMNVECIVLEKHFNYKPHKPFREKKYNSTKTYFHLNVSKNSFRGVLTIS